MASHSFVVSESHDFVETDEGTSELVSKEASTTLTASAMAQLLGSIQTLATTVTTMTATVANQDRRLQDALQGQNEEMSRMREEGRRWREEDRKRQDLALAEAVAISKASERYAMEIEKHTMEVLDDLRGRQDDLEDELQSDYDPTAHRHPGQPNPDSHAPQGPRIADFVCPQRMTSVCPEGLSTGNAHPDYTGQRSWTRAGTHVRTPAGPAFIVFAS